MQMNPSTCSVSAANHFDDFISEDKWAVAYSGHRLHCWYESVIFTHMNGCSYGFLEAVTQYIRSKDKCAQGQITTFV